MSPTSTARVVALVLGVCAVGMVLRFPGALPGPRVVSAHDHLTVHPLFQEAGSDDHGRVKHPHLSDPALQFEALDRRTVAALRAGQAPLWNPDLFGGAPLLGDGQSRPLSPVTLLKALLPQWPRVAQDLGVTWLMAWCALGFTLLVRRLGIQAPAALAVAASTALTTPFLSVWLLHPHASTFVWLPWCLLAIESGSMLGTAAAVFGLWTGGHPGTWLHVGTLVSLWWWIRSRGGHPIWGALAGTALAAPIWGPLLEQVQRSTTLQARVGGVLEPALLLDLVWPGYWGHPATETWTGPGSWADGQLHPGWAAWALGGVGLLRSVRQQRGWLVVGLVGVGCTVGAVVGLPGPIAHGRLASIAAVGWVLVAAYGTAGLAERWPRWIWLAPLAVLASGTWARWNDQNTLPADQHAPSSADWVAPLQAVVEDGRVLGVGWALQPNTGALAGLRDLRGYDLPVSTDTHALMEALSQRPRGPWYPVDTLPSAALLEWWNVRAVVAFPQDADRTAEWAATAGWEPLPLDPGSPLQAWIDPAPEPPARVFFRTAVSQAPTDALRRTVRRTDPGLVFTGPGVAPLVGSGPAAAAELEWDGGSRMALTWPSLSQEGLVVVPEAWAPGWRARLRDGTPTRVWRAAGLGIGVSVPVGSTGAELYYRPDGWIRGQWGFWVGVAMLLIGGVATVRRQRERRVPVPATMPDGGASHPHTASASSTNAAKAGGRGDATRSDATSTAEPGATRRT